jgi:hypothetical protein
MESFKIGDRVRVAPGVAIPFVGHEGIIHDVQPNDRGIETMDRHVVVFARGEKRSFYREELVQIPKGK